MVKEYIPLTAGQGKDNYEVLGRCFVLLSKGYNYLRSGEFFLRPDEEKGNNQSRTVTKPSPPPCKNAFQIEYRFYAGLLYCTEFSSYCKTNQVSSFLIDRELTGNCV